VIPTVDRRNRNGPAGRDDADVVNTGVVVGLGLSVRTWTRLVDAGRRLHVDGLVGPLFVEAGHERVESFLLAAQRMGRRPGRFLLQGPVHALVVAILLGMADRHALMSQAQGHPPGAQ